MKAAGNAVLVFIADTHSGSTTGLIRDKWQLKDGGDYWPSYNQQIIWRQFKEGMERAAKLRKDLDARLLVFMVGDPCDNDHHNTTQLITRDTGQHVGIHTDAMDHGLRMLGADYQLRYISGTMKHNGGLDEKCAEDLEAIPYRKPSEQGKKDGRYTFPDMRFTVNGKLFFVVHRGAGTSKSPWLSENGVYNELKRQYWRARDHEEKPLDYYICAHYHQHITATYRKTKGILLPALQAKTEYAESVAPFVPSDIGIYIVAVRANGESFEEPCIMELPYGEVEAL